MKKIVLSIAFICVFSGALAAQQITVTNPVSVNSWQAGKLYDIIWTKTGTMGDRVLIRLRNAAGIALDIALDTENDGLFCWTIPTSLPPGQYYVRIKTLEMPAVTGDSVVFTITAPPPPSLIMQAPQGGETWEIGSTKKIQWLASNVPVNCRLVLLKNGQVQGTIRDPFAPGQGESFWNWKVGDYPGGPAAAVSGYKIRIEAVDGQVSAESANPFTIAPLPLVINYNPIPKPDYRVLASLRPDLVVCAEWTSKRPQLGDKRTVTVKVKNIGPGAAPAANFDFYVEGHGTANIPLPALAKNAEYSYAHTFWWNSWGHKTVRITIDPKNQVTEVNENNNQVSGSIEVILMRDAYGTLTSRCSDQN